MESDTVRTHDVREQCQPSGPGNAPKTRRRYIQYLSRTNFGAAGEQDYIEDCAVCCRPWNVSVTYHDDGTADIVVDASDDQ